MFNLVGKLIRITTIYNEVLYRKVLKRTKTGIITDLGFIYFDDIQFVDIIGDFND